MSSDFAVELIRRAVWLTLSVAGPMLLVALVVGVIVSLIQAVTQIQEQTLTFIPKLVALAAMFIVTLPWIVSRLIGYLVGIIQNMGTMAN
jgi:flagellar biosynthesis protein FliQ